MTTNKPFLDAAETEQLIQRLAQDLRQRLDARGIERPLMIGIHTGGVWLAESLHRLLAIPDPLGTLDISFYRDDFTRIGVNPQVRPSNLPVPVDDRHILLVDDVLETGRTIRAALNEIFDYGRPASVQLITLIAKGGRELPIQPDLVGLRPQLTAEEHITLTGPEPLALILGEGSNRSSRQQQGAG
jgi:pyrimidine operon attenuation protein/uracil phosphoribosyltransferase